MTYRRGCFGALTVFGHDDKACERCANTVECAEKVREVMPLISERVDISDIVMTHRNGMIEAGQSENLPESANVQAQPTGRKTAVRKVKYALNAEQKALCETLPKKAAKILDTLIRNGKFSGMLTLPQRGINPFRDGSPNWLEVAFDALIAGGFSKSELRELLMEKLQWAENTAYPHVTKTVAILTAIGVADEEAGRFTLAA